MRVELAQSVEALAGPATTMFGGRLSVKLRLAAPAPFAVLSMVKVSVDLPPKKMLDGEKALEKPGRSVATVRSAVAGPLLPLSDVRSPEMLVCVPGVELVTSTLTVQLVDPPTPPPE